jgi:3-hydroxyisobutyrate dehydrogenase
VPDVDSFAAIAPHSSRGAALAPGSIWVQMSTIGVAGIERVTALVDQERPDVTLFDAPVSGSKDPAEHGELTIFASGPDDVRPRVTPLFEALGQQTLWVGQSAAARGRS